MISILVTDSADDIRCQLQRIATTRGIGIFKIIFHFKSKNLFFFVFFFLDYFYFRDFSRRRRRRDEKGNIAKDLCCFCFCFNQTNVVERIFFTEKKKKEIFLCFALT